MHPVFSADRLRKHPDNPIPGQKAPETPPEDVNGYPEWEVQEILTSRLHRGELQTRLGIRQQT